MNIKTIYKCWILIIVFSAFCSCKNNAETQTQENKKLILEENSDMSKLILAIKENIDNSPEKDECEKPQITTDSGGGLEVFYKIKGMDANAIGAGSYISYNFNESIKGDINNDGASDFLVLTVETCPPANVYMAVYDIYINNEGKYKNVGSFQSGSNHSEHVQFSYIKNGKVYGRCSDDGAYLNLENRKPAKDVVYELVGSTLKQIGK